MARRADGAMKEETGAAAVELALALPVYLFLIFGLIQVVLLLHARILLDQAAYEAMRAGVVLAGGDLVTKRANRVASIIPRGAGFMRADPKVSLKRQGDSLLIEIDAEFMLLPFIRQAAMTAGGPGTIKLSGRAIGRVEPWLGYVGE